MGAMTNSFDGGVEGESCNVVLFSRAHTSGLKALSASFLIEKWRMISSSTLLRTILSQALPEPSTRRRGESGQTGEGRSSTPSVTSTLIVIYLG